MPNRARACNRRYMSAEPKSISLSLPIGFPKLLDPVSVADLVCPPAKQIQDLFASKKPVLQRPRLPQAEI